MPSRRSAALLVLALACGFAAPPCPASIGSTPSREEIEAAAAKLRADPNLGGKKQIRTLRWTQQQTPTPSTAPAWLAGLFEFLGQAAGVLFWVAGAIGVAVAAIWIIRTVRARAPRGVAPMGASVERVGGLDIRPDSLPEDVGAAALGLLEGGRTRDALSLLYRGALSRAVHRFGVAIGESYTEGEALRAVRAGLDAPRAAYFSDLIVIWQRAVYAGEAVADEPIALLCRGFLPTLDGAPR